MKTLVGKQFDVRNKLKIKMDSIGELTLRVIISTKAKQAKTLKG